jgi:transcriptional antiterminator NusG
MEEQERVEEQSAGVPDNPEPGPPFSPLPSSATGEGPGVRAGESEASADLDKELPDLDLTVSEPEAGEAEEPALSTVDGAAEGEAEEQPVVDIRAILRQARETAVVEEAPREEPEPPAAPSDERAWYVIHCYSGYEKKVKHNLEQRIETMGMAAQIFQVIVPTEEEIEVKEGKRRTVERRVFPGYILVQMLMNDDSWYVVRNTPGVTGFVGMGNKPTPLRQEEVTNILKRMEAEAPKVKVTFKPGQKVRIIDGPFNDFMGVVDEIDMDKAKARVMVSFFGRDTPVELDFLQVEKV